MSEDQHAADIKNNDPYGFVKADDFFWGIDNDPGTKQEVKQPKKATFLEEDQKYKVNGKLETNPVTSHGKIFRLLDEFGRPSFLLLQFIRPRVWRVRFRPDAEEKPDFSDFNSRNTICSTMTELITMLDKLQRITWNVELIDCKSHFVLQSVVTKADGKKVPECQLWLQKNPIKITAVRLLENAEPVEALPTPSTTDQAIKDRLTLKEVKGYDSAVVWETSDNFLKYWRTATILSIQTSPTSQYLGFGEQGGQHLFKQQKFMNYFNFDNMKYQNVYNGGPLDDREPLYHSEPYWMEVANHTGFRGMMGTMVDNYSHTCLDIRTRTDVNHQNVIRVATRFNEFNLMKVAADNVSELIQSYTSVVGKPRLKPRYALGYHQGCYGNDTRDLVIDSVNKYHDYSFPIDGYHIDIDMQREYKTFTIDYQNWFKDPEGMFHYLRSKGVKCSTNITPHINALDDPTYQTLNEMKSLKYAVMDNRDKNPGVTVASLERYHNWEGGNRVLINPSVEKTDYDPPDQVAFADTYNKGNEFRGGLYYGNKLGAPTYYPNLNNYRVREWWGKQYKYLFETGLEFVWQDMTSPCIAREYGDMKSLPFRLLLDRDVRREEREHIKATGQGEPEQKKAIELWSLYSYNLHKATFHGLENLHTLSKELAWRKGRRNFIIGRGSMIGSHRFAGLWTGDNESSWDFLKISVVQPLALGLSGITIAGQDVGGFEIYKNECDFADPQLMIRWYGAYSLLPWFRNHYTKRRYWGGQPGKRDKPGKLFQEPYAYAEWYNDHRNDFWNKPEEAVIYNAVLPLCKWFVRLRYSLMQLLYDAMFENVITGLPIARAMVITDDQDKTLFSTNQELTSSQYMVRHDLLVAPRLTQQSPNTDLKIYLPYPDKWYHLNLEPDNEYGRPLGDAVPGGTYFYYNCNISDNYAQFPYVTPMYLREGAIIPKIPTRMSTPDFYPPEKAGTLPKPEPNPITFHIYPGKDNTYKMYIDDGISMNSEPLAKLLHLEKFAGRIADKYCEVHVEQKRYYDENDLKHRDVKIWSPWNGYDSTVYKLEDIIGTTFTFIIWHRQSWYDKSKVVVEVGKDVKVTDKPDLRATIIEIPTKFLNDEAARKAGITFKTTYVPK